MADSGITAIDRVFDLVDSVVDKADRVLNRTKYTEDQHRARRARMAEVDTSPSVKVKPKTSKAEDAPPASSTSSTALATRQFRIVEVIAAESGQTIFVVTNGGSARAECSTRKLAEKILRALETAP